MGSKIGTTTTLRETESGSRISNLISLGLSYFDRDCLGTRDGSDRDGDSMRTALWRKTIAKFGFEFEYLSTSRNREISKVKISVLCLSSAWMEERD